MSRLLLSRMYSGFGDWIMLTAIIKMFNNTRPDIEIDLFARSQNPAKLLQLPYLCGARLRLTVDGNRDHYDWVCPHAVYPNPRPATDEPLVVGMLNRICEVCPGVVVPYDPDVRAQTLVHTAVPIPEIPYVVMPSAGRGEQLRRVGYALYAYSLPKEWPGLAELAQRLSQHFPIVQVGLQDDAPLPGAAYRYLDVPLEVLDFLYSRARFAVALENGLSHWAGHHNTRCYTLYTSDIHARPEHVGYPTQIPITAATGLSVDAVYATIMQTEAKTYVGPVAVL